MIWLDFKRVLKAGFLNFWRNGVVSLSAILIVTITLFVMGSLLFVGVLLQSSLAQIQSKVDVNIYFVPTAPEEEVIAIKSELEGLPEVETVEYISREEAIENFRLRHENDYLTIQSLEELDDNPLGARLNVTAKEVSQYESIAKYLESGNAISASGTSIIDSVNYYENKEAIGKLGNIINGANLLGFAVTIVLAVISVIITFNTIRMAIYMARDEISVMRLVGANNRYIRGPFVVEGAMYGVVAALFALALFYPVTYWLGDATMKFFSGVNVFDYYIANFGQIFGMLLLTGVLLGSVSSYLAVRKYLKV